MLFLPEKQTVFIQSVTDVLLAKNQKCVVNRSKISECIKNITYEVIGKYAKDGIYSTAVVACIRRIDLFKSLSDGQKDLDPNELINAGKRYDFVNGTGK